MDVGKIKKNNCDINIEVNNYEEFLQKFESKWISFNSLILLSTIYQLKRRWRENKATELPLKCLFLNLIVKIEINILRGKRHCCPCKLCGIG